jgi:hypothetical protein
MSWGAVTGVVVRVEGSRDLFSNLQVDLLELEATIELRMQCCGDFPRISLDVRPAPQMPYFSRSKIGLLDQSEVPGSGS